MTRKGTLEEADCTYLVYIERKARVEIHYTLPLHNALQNKHTKKSYNSNTTHSRIHPHLQARKEVQKIRPTFVVYRRKTTTEITELCYSFNAEVIQTKTGQKTLT